QQVTDGIQQMAPMVGQPAQKLLSGNQQVTDGLKELQANNDELKSKIDDAVSQQNNVSFESENEKALNDVTKVNENNPTNADEYIYNFNETSFREICIIYRSRCVVCTVHEQLGIVCI